MTRSKVYRHRRFIYAELSVTMPDGLTKRIVFGNGKQYPRSNGFLRTEDEVLQEILEKHPLYGKAYFLEKVNGKSVVPTVEGEDKFQKLEDDLKVSNAKVKELTEEMNKLVAENEGLKLELKENKPEKPAKENKEPEKEEETPKVGKTVIEVKNLQEAKEILKAEPYNVAANKMAQEKALLNRAEELNVEFKIVQ